MGTEGLELLSFVSDFILEEVCQFAFLWRQTFPLVIFKRKGTKAALVDSGRCEWLCGVRKPYPGSASSLGMWFQSCGSRERREQTLLFFFLFS